MADPGFPRWGRQPPRRKRKSIRSIWQDFCQNCMKIKEIGPRGARVPSAPFGSANGECLIFSLLILFCCLSYFHCSCYKYTWLIWGSLAMARSQGLIFLNSSSYESTNFRTSSCTIKSMLNRHPQTHIYHPQQ